jgi:hypothetical protein
MALELESIIIRHREYHREVIANVIAEFGAKEKLLISKVLLTTNSDGVV